MDTGNNSVRAFERIRKQNNGICIKFRAGTAIVRYSAIPS